MKGVNRLYQLQVVVGDDELLQQSLESGQLSHPGMKPNCVNKLAFFSCIHTQRLLISSYQRFKTLPLRSRVKNKFKILPKTL